MPRLVLKPMRERSKVELAELSESIALNWGRNRLSIAPGNRMESSIHYPDKREETEPRRYESSEQYTGRA